MTLIDLLSAAQMTGKQRVSSEKQEPHKPENVFSAYLDHFRETVKSRVQLAEEEAKNAELEYQRAIMRSLEPMLYTKIRQEVLLEKGVGRDERNEMTEQQRISIEAEVYARVREELVQRMGEDCDCQSGKGCNGACEVERDKIRLYSAAPFLIS